MGKPNSHKGWREVAPAVTARMRRTKRRDTPAELALRSALHQRGHRYRVDYAPLGGRRRADIVFTRARVAVFVDGCFWHGCPEHGTWPRSNRTQWSQKLKDNILRDRSSDSELRDSGWAVVRVWEHESIDQACTRIESVLYRRGRDSD
jgi:DNA mismatch endonuclease (patch repair protein)